MLLCNICQGVPGCGVPCAWLVDTAPLFGRVLPRLRGWGKEVLQQAVACSRCRQLLTSAAHFWVCPSWGGMQVQSGVWAIVALVVSMFECWGQVFGNRGWGRGVTLKHGRVSLCMHRTSAPVEYQHSTVWLISKPGVAGLWGVGRQGWGGVGGQYSFLTEHIDLWHCQMLTIWVVWAVHAQRRCC